VESLPKQHKLGARLVCPEYSKSAQEVKTYPLLENDRMFILCWRFTGTHQLRASMYPSPKPFCYHKDFGTGTKTQLHTHDYIELGYVVKGEFHQKILGTDTTFTEGDLWLIDKNCLHQDYLTDTPAEILFLGIANDMFNEIMDDGVTTEKIISFLQSALLKQKDLQQYLHFKPKADGTAGLEACLTQLLLELTGNQPGTRFIRKGLLIRIFSTISTKYDFALSKELRKTMNWIVFEEISQYIQKNYNTVTIQALSEVFHFQEDYFNRLIKSKTGMTYSAYVQQLRLNKAEQLLTSTSKSVEEIAGIVGYQNRGFFYKLFMKKNHMTPAEYRKNQL